MFAHRGAALADTNSYGTFSPVWGANSLIVVNDPTGDQIGGSGRDTTSILWEYDHDFRYFRINLAGPPMAVTGGWAESCGIYIDGIAGQGSTPGTAVVPVELSGIDWLFDFRGEAVIVAPGSVLDPNPHTSANRLYFREWSPSNAFVQIRDFTNTPEDYFTVFLDT